MEAYEKFLVPNNLQFAIKTLDKAASEISEKENNNQRFLS